jgi:hypothetical protein
MAESALTVRGTGVSGWYTTEERLERVGDGLKVRVGLNWA